LHVLIPQAFAKASACKACPLLPRREGGKNLNINVIAPLPWERGWGEVKERERAERKKTALQGCFSEEPACRAAKGVMCE